MLGKECHNLEEGSQSQSSKRPSEIQVGRFEGNYIRLGHIGPFSNHIGAENADVRPAHRPLGALAIANSFLAGPTSYNKLSMVRHAHVVYPLPQQFVRQKEKGDDLIIRFEPFRRSDALANNSETFFKYL